MYKQAQELETGRKASLWHAFLVQINSYVYQHCTCIVFILQCQKVQNNCQILLYSLYSFFQGWTKEKIKLKLENSYILSTGSLEDNMLTIDSSMCDVILINGRLNSTNPYFKIL